MEEYQGWQYAGQKNGDVMNFDVKPSEDKEIPDSFFKYCSLNEKSVEALTRCYVYASHPNQLNDSVDCNSQILDFQTASQEDLKSFYGAELYPKYLEVYGNEQNLRSNMHEHFKLVSYNHIGIVSLSTRNDSIYFWNSYAQSGQGFCIEWDVRNFPFRYFGPFPVHYVDKITPFKVHSNIPTALLIQTNVKTKDWESEQEWRLLVSNPMGLDFNSWDDDGSYSQQYNFGGEHNRKMKYPIEAIKSVTLGERFFRSPNIRQYPITNDEREVVFLSKKETLRCRVLDFLSSVYLCAYQIKNELGAIHVQPIEVVKIQSRVYRIINNEKEI